MNTPNLFDCLPGTPGRSCVPSDCRDHGRARGSRGHDHGPSDGRAQTGRDLHPSNQRSTVLRHGAEQPNERLRTAAGSNSQRATYSDVRPDTSNPRPKQRRARVSQALLQLRGVLAERRF